MSNFKFSYFIISEAQQSVYLPYMLIMYEFLDRSYWSIYFVEQRYQLCLCIELCIENIFLLVFFFLALYMVYIFF